MLVGLGVISKQNYDRMQDVQLVSELLILVLQGPQHRRDSLDAMYELYRAPTGSAKKDLEAARDNVTAVVNQIFEIADATALQALHFPSACENDFYGLVGALRARGLLTAPQLARLGGELREVVSGFRQQVETYVAKVRDGEAPLPDEFSPLVRTMAAAFLEARSTRGPGEKTASGCGRRSSIPWSRRSTQRQRSPSFSAALSGRGVRTSSARGAETSCRGPSITRVTGSHEPPVAIPRWTTDRLSTRSATKKPGRSR